MIKIDSLSKSYDIPVLTNFHYTFPERGLFLIRGKSGVGKTTLLRILMGLETPDEGTVTGLPDKISAVFQEDRLLPFLTLKENVLLVKKEKEKEALNSLLKEFGLWEAKDKYPKELSGGMRLRGAIVRSLYFGGRVYLWDEPTKELDPENRALVIGAARRVAKDALVLVVTHDPDFTCGTEIKL